MSEFSYQIPTLREIEESLERTWEVIRESERLTRKQLMSSRVICNRCHLCCCGGCSKVPCYSKLSRPEFIVKTNPAIKSLHYKNIELAEENKKLTNTVENLSKVIGKNSYGLRESKGEKLSSSHYGVSSRIWELEEKVSKIEKEFENSLGKSGLSTNVSDGFYSLSKEMDKAGSRFIKLAEKIDQVERKLNEPKDRHCARCIPLNRY